MVIVATSAVSAGAAMAAPGSQTFTFNDQTQYFTVPAGVNQVQLTGWGGSGGGSQRFSNSGEYDALGGLGAEISEVVAVHPGDTLVVEVGGAGQPAGARSGGAGGLSSGDTENGGAGGSISSSAADGLAGGGGGGGTQVVDARTGQILLSAGGGGGAGGAGTDRPRTEAKGPMRGAPR